MDQPALLDGGPQRAANRRLPPKARSTRDRRQRHRRLGRRPTGTPGQTGPRPAADREPPKPVPRAAAGGRRPGQRRGRQEGGLRPARAQHRSVGAGPIPAERRDEILRGALDQLVDYTLLSQEAQDAQDHGRRRRDRRAHRRQMQRAVPDRGSVQEGAQRARHDARPPARRCARGYRDHQADGGRGGAGASRRPTPSARTSTTRIRTSSSRRGGPRQPHPDSRRREGGRRRRRRRPREPRSRRCCKRVKAGEDFAKLAQETLAGRQRRRRAAT